MWFSVKFLDIKEIRYLPSTSTLGWIAGGITAAALIGAVAALGPLDLGRTVYNQWIGNGPLLKE